MVRNSGGIADADDILSLDASRLRIADLHESSELS